MNSTFEHALRLQADAAAVGFDWPTTEGVLEKIREELGELTAAIEGTAARHDLEAELGDLLFVIANLARRIEINPEAALSAACKKFERRFAHIHNRLRESGRTPEACGLDELEALWQEAKRLERGLA